MKTKIACLVEPGKFEIREEEIETKPMQVLIKINVCGLCSWEIFHFKGKIGGSYPMCIGHEPAGVIVEVGKEVKNWKRGDKVTGFFGPGFSEYAIANPENLIRIRKNIQTEYALGEPLACLLNIIRAGKIEPADFVLIVGCGFMGLGAISIIAHSNAAKIIAVDVLNNKLALAKELGATDIINPEEVNAEEEIKKITAGRGVDVAIEATGRTSGIELATKSMRFKRGRLLMVTSHSEPTTLNLQYLERGTILIGAHPPYSLDIKDELRRAMLCLEKGYPPMEKLITHRFKLEEIQKTFELLSSKSIDYIKGIVIPHT